MAPFEIRLAQPEEYAAVGDLTVEAYVADGFLETSESYADNLRDAASRAADAELWVAADDSSVLGSVTYCPPGSRYCEVATGPDQGEFRMLAVAPRARRGGVGRALVEHCIARSRTLGHRELVMSSSASMTAAHRVYAALGFVPAPELDWSPLPRLQLLGFRLTLVRAADPSAAPGEDATGAPCPGFTHEPRHHEPLANAAARLNRVGSGTAPNPRRPG